MHHDDYEATYERQDLVPLVQDGARWLDEQRPGWANRIDLDKLDMSQYDVCILGQLGGYWYNLNEWFWRESNAIDHGFYLPDDVEIDDETYDVDHPDSYLVLTELWREQIIRRRNAA